MGFCIIILGFSYSSPLYFRCLWAVGSWAREEGKVGNLRLVGWICTMTTLSCWICKRLGKGSSQKAGLRRDHVLVVLHREGLIDE